MHSPSLYTTQNLKIARSGLLHLLAHYLMHAIEAYFALYIYIYTLSVRREVGINICIMYIQL